MIRKKAADRIDIGRGALDQLAGLRFVVIAERETLNVIVEVIAQTLYDAFRRLRRKPSAPEREVALQQRHADETQRDDEQD